MDILFCEAPIEEDINSILSLLTLNEEHTRVKKYICEYFHIPTEPYLHLHPYPVNVDWIP